MQHYIDPKTGELFGFEQASQAPSHLIPCELPPSPYHEFKNGKWVLSKAKGKQQLADELANLRSIRDDLLAKSDWAVLPDCPLSAVKAVLAYRKALRDVMQQKDPMAALQLATAKAPQQLK